VLRAEPLHERAGGQAGIRRDIGKRLFRGSVMLHDTVGRLEDLVVGRFPRSGHLPLFTVSKLRFIKTAPG
jgi:hypothetical protein